MRRLTVRPIASFALCHKFFTGRAGLEVGGPSSIFARRGLFPVYPNAAHIDNCNFSANTMWEGELEGGATFQYDKRRPRGRQYFFEATDLSAISSESYDFVLSSHVLEHVADPLRALSEWIRVIRPEGILVLIVPHVEGSFDHRRPVTTLEHLITDFEQGMSETDTTHLAEILELHDVSRDPEAGGMDAFEKRARNNLENRGLHHHVFNTRLAINLVHYSDLQILAVEAARPFHIFVVAQKLKNAEIPNNNLFMSDDAAYKQSSPFLCDKRGSQSDLTECKVVRRP